MYDPAYFDNRDPVKYEAPEEGGDDMDMEGGEDTEDEDTGSDDTGSEAPADEPADEPAPASGKSSAES